MEIIKNNKGVIAFYLLIVISAFILKFNNDKNIDLEKNNLIVYNDILN